MDSLRIARKTGIAIAWLMAATIIASAASAQDAAKADEGAIKYRQSLMESVGGDMASIGNILKYGLPLTGNVVVHAEGLASHAKLVGSAFERKVSAGRTDAQPAIWEKPDAFKEKVKVFETETAKLVEVAKAGDPAALGVQMKATGKSCGGCHDDYRKPKEESFKRTSGGE
jgi:cytochrome c556